MPLPVAVLLGVSLTPACARRATENDERLGLEASTTGVRFYLEVVRRVAAR